MRDKAKMQSKFMHYMEKPKKILHKAMDFYVKSMEDCANMINSGGVVVAGTVGPTAHVCRRLPRSFSVNYSKPGNDEVSREVLAAAVTKIQMKNENELNCVKEKEITRQQKMENIRAVKRSYTSVGLGKIGTIDEDEPCYFEDDMIYARSTTFDFLRNFEY